MRTPPAVVPAGVRRIVFHRRLIGVAGLFEEPERPQLVVEHVEGRRRPCSRQHEDGVAAALTAHGEDAADRFLAQVIPNLQGWEIRGQERRANR